MSNSGFTDPGYTITATAYNSSNAAITNIKQPGLDMFQAVNRCGVFMINGSNSNNNFYPIYCSANYSDIGIPGIADDAYLVYPGWGFQLFTNTKGTGTASKIYYNTKTSPEIFGLGGSSFTALVQQSTSSTLYTSNTTMSWRIYYRGEEVKITQLSF